MIRASSTFRTDLFDDLVVDNFAGDGRGAGARERLRRRERGSCVVKPENLDYVKGADVE